MEFRKYWAILLRRKWLILESAILLPFLALILFKITSPIFQCKAKLLVQTNNFEQLFVSGIPKEFGQLFFSDPGKLMGTVEELLQSDPVAEKTINNLSLKGKHGKKVKKDDFVDPNIISLLLKKQGVGITNLPASEIFEITGYSGSPSEARRITEEYIANFLSEIAAKYKSEVSRAKEIIQKSIADTKVKVVESEKMVSDYEYKNKFYNASRQIDIEISQIATYKDEKNKAVRSVEETQKSLTAIQEAAWTDQEQFRKILVKIEDNPLVTEYKKQLLSLEENAARQKVELTTEHPDVKAVQEDIAVVRENIQREVSKVLASSITERESFYDTMSRNYADDVTTISKLTARIKVLDEQIKGQQKVLDEIPEKERKLGELEREAEVFVKQYTSLCSNLAAVTNAERMDLSNVIVFKPVELGISAYFPPEGYETLLMLALFGGLFLGIFLAFFIDYLDPRLKTPDEVRKGLNPDIMLVLPKVRVGRFVMSREARSPLADSIWDIFSNISVLKGWKERQAISIVSTAGKTGKSVFAAHLAYTLAQANKKTLLVDGNLRSPALHTLFNLEKGKGLSDYLVGEVNVRDILRKTFSAGLDIITAGSVSIEQPQKYFQSEKFAGFLEELKGMYDFIILDTPPWAAGADALAVSARIGKTLFLIKLRKTTLQEEQQFVDTLKGAKIEILGVIVVEA